MSTQAAESGMIDVLLIILTFSFLTYGCLLLVYRARLHRVHLPPKYKTYLAAGSNPHVHFPTFLACPILSSTINQSRWAPSKSFPLGSSVG